jgi:hypothetical protein
VNVLPSEARYHQDAPFHARVEATRAQLLLDGVDGNPLLIADVLHAYDRSGIARAMGPWDESA